MLISALLAFVLTQAPPLASAASNTRVLVMDMEAVGVEAATAQAATRAVANAAGEVAGFTVMSTQDLRRMLELEAERMNLGCTDESCLTELADAMGAELVVFGTLSRLGAQTSLTLSLYSSTTQQVRRRVVDHVDDAALSSTLRTTTIALLKDRDPPSPVPLALGLVGGGVGGAAAIGSTVLLLQPQTTDKDVWRIVGIAGVGLAVVGGVVAVVGAVPMVLE